MKVITILYEGNKYNAFSPYIFRYVFGKEEAKKSKKAVTDDKETTVEKLPESDTFLQLNAIGSMTEPVSSKMESDFLQKLWDETRHISCPHNLSCMQYTIQVFLFFFLRKYLSVYYCTFNL